MAGIWEAIVALCLYGTLPLLGGVWLLNRVRMARRNRHGECAICGKSMRSVESSERFLIHGRLVCPGCAARARRRIGWQFGALGLCAAFATAIALDGAETSIMVLFPATFLAGTTPGAVHLMKRANRRAQRRITAGEDHAPPILEAVEGALTRG